MLTVPSRSLETGKLLIPGRGNPLSKILIIASHPSSIDCQKYELFHQSKDNGAAQELFDALEVNGLNLDNVYITAICKSGLGSKSKPKASDISESYPYLEEEINEIKPELIIALGAEVFKRVLKKNVKISDYLGELIDCPYNCKLLANHSPGTVVAVDPTRRGEFQENFHLARRFITKQLAYDKFDYVVIDNVSDAEYVINHYVENKMFYCGYDMEWLSPSGKWHDNEKVYTFQFSCEKDKAIIFDLLKDPAGKENLDLLNTAKLLLEHPEIKRMGWNIRADDKRLRYRGFNLKEANLFFDGMKAVGFFDSRWGRGLETGIKRFTNYESYYTPFNVYLRENKINKSEMSCVKFSNPDLFYHYCAGDAVSHREACLNMFKQFPENLKNYFFEVYMPLGDYLLDIEMTGIPIDIGLMEKITKQYEEKYNSLLKSLHEKLSAIGVEDFNPNSAIQKKNVLFEKLNLTPAYYTKSGKSPRPRSWWLKKSKQVQAQYSPSTNGRSLSTIFFELQGHLKIAPDDIAKDISIKIDIVKNLLDLNRIAVFSNKFLSKKGVNTLDELEDLLDDVELEAPEDLESDPLKQSYWNAINKDGIMRVDFFECLKNFRTSSSPNCQNPANKVLAFISPIFVPNYYELPKEERKVADKEIIPANIRNSFYSRNQPNWLYACSDVASADLGVQAFLSKDSKFITAIRAGGFHLKKMKEYFQNDKLTKDDTNYYTSAKAISFNCSYIAELEQAALPIQAIIFAESGFMLQLEEVEYALKTWYGYPDYINYREKCKQEVLEYDQITNARGMVLKFDKTNDFAIKAGYLNQSLSFPIGSEMTLFVFDCAVQLKNQFIKDGLWMKHIKPCNIVHDDLQFLLKEDLMKDNYFPEVIRYYMTNKVKLASGDNLGCELNVGTCWKDKNPIYSKETIWHNNEWVWQN